MDAQWSDDFHHSLHALLTGEQRGYYEDYGTVEQLARAWRRGFTFDGRRSSYRGRRHGRPTGELPTSRFLAYSQNHDQVGNRATGDRPSATLDTRALKLASAAVILSPFIPMLFQGEEWGTKGVFQYFTSHEDEGLAQSVREGRAEEFADFVAEKSDVPDPQAVETFRRSGLAWEELDHAEHQEMLEWYRALIRLRHEHASLRTGMLGDDDVTHSDNPRWLVVRRGPFTLVFNFDIRDIAAPVNVETGQAPLLANQPGVKISENSVTLRANGFALFGPRE
jgi:maltooligosyltrehalose trehalohydrolase